MMPHDFVIREGCNIKNWNLSCNNQAMVTNELTPGY